MRRCIQSRRRWTARAFPGLVEVLRLVVASRVRADVELKTLADAPESTVDPEAMAECVLAAAAEAGALGAVDVRSFDWRGLRAVRRLRPELPLTFLTSAPTAPRTVAAEHAGATWAPEHATLTRAALEEARALGLRVAPWTVNDPDDMRRFADWGVDGICTDRPDLALALS